MGARNMRTLCLKLPAASCNSKLRVCCATSSVQGKRPRQEDRLQSQAQLKLCPRFPKKGSDEGEKDKGKDSDWSFFAVYDGHSGARCSEYLQQTLHDHIVTVANKKFGNSLNGRPRMPSRAVAEGGGDES